MTEMFTEKYRPYFIDDLVGQERAKKTIGAWLRTGRVPRSILISGVTSSGKTTLARILARSVLCLDSKDGVACATCHSCKQFDTNREGHMAYNEMNAASERGINDMRELTKKLAFRPMMSKHKVIVLDEAHMITKPGWQAMLKPLEEPPAHVIIIVLTTEPEKLPDTIRNRCSKIALPGITVDQCTNLLVDVARGAGLGKAGVEKKHLTEIAKAVKAHPRDALHALDQVYTMVLDATAAGQTITDAIINGFVADVAVQDIEKMAAQIVRRVLTGKPGGALAIAGDLFNEADQLLTEATEMMRQAMLLSTSPKLLDPYFKRVFADIPIFDLTPQFLVEGDKKKRNRNSMAARKAILNAYACFTDLRISVSNYTVPVGEVIGEAICRAALIVQDFEQSVSSKERKVKAGKPAANGAGASA